MADIPLPRDTARAFRAAGRDCRNFGLLFDRFVGYGPGWTMEGGHKSSEAQRLVEACNGWHSDGAYRQLFEAMRRRWQRVIEAAGGAFFSASPEWRLVVGLGRDSAFETGLSLHRVYGCPYVPGSALKGMTKAWARVMEPEREDVTAAKIEQVFGSEDTEEAHAGAAVFFDALPVSPPRLELDMMNPHYPEYYRPGNREYPTDWQSPVPVYFITVAAGTEFLFGVGARTADPDIVSSAQNWLRRALGTMGIGGKTTSGYGYWEFGNDGAATSS